MVHGAWCMYAWCMVHGAWCMVLGTWCICPDPFFWYMVHGTWCMVHGAGYMVHGAGYMVHFFFVAPPHFCRAKNAPPHFCTPNLGGFWEDFGWTSRKATCVHALSLSLYIYIYIYISLYLLRQIYCCDKYTLACWGPNKPFHTFRHHKTRNKKTIHLVYAVFQKHAM